MSPINEREFAEDLLYFRPEMNLPFKYDYKENTAVRNGELAIPSASILVVDDDEAIGRVVRELSAHKGVFTCGSVERLGSSGNPKSNAY